MSMELKIKVMSLAAEARIIRAQEERITRRLRCNRKKFTAPLTANTEREIKVIAQISDADDLRTSLRRHRLFDVRVEARATCWVRAWLAGREYGEIEDHRRYIQVDERVKLEGLVGAMLLKYGAGKLPVKLPGDNRKDIDRALKVLEDWLKQPMSLALLQKQAKAKEKAQAALQARRKALKKAHDSDPAPSVNGRVEWGA